MTQLSDAADQTIALAEKFRAVLALADAVKGLGSIDQAISERTTAREAALADHAKASGDLARTVAELDQFRALAADEIDGHKKSIADEKAAAKTAAAKIISDATTKAADIAAASLEAQSKIRDDHEAILAAHCDELAKIQADIASANALVIASRSELAQVTAQTSALREAAKTVIGSFPALPETAAE